MRLAPLLLLAGCLLGADPRDHAGVTGDPCEERTQCTWDLTCSEELEECVPWCIDDEDCPDGWYCDAGLDDELVFYNDGCKEVG